MSMILLAKLALAPTIVASGTQAGRRWGHQVGGLVAGFPNTSSPILLFLALERSGAFAATAAVSVLLGLVALAVYGLIYVWAATRFKWWLALPLGWSGFLFTAWELKRVEMGAWPAAALAVLALGLSLKFMPDLSGPDGFQAPLIKPKSHLVFRMAAAVGLVLGITAMAGWFGPGLSGVLSAFPIASSVLTAGAHREAGAAGAKWVLMGIYTALLALILFTALLPGLLAGMDLVPAFTLATAVGFMAQALLLWRRHQAAWVVSRL